MAIAGLADGLRRWLREVVGLKVQLAIGELGDCGLAVVPPWGSQPHGRPTRSEPGSSVSPVERDADLEVAERIDARCPRTESRAASRACPRDSRRGASARDREGSLVRCLDRSPISAPGRRCQCATSTGRARRQGRLRTPPKVPRPAPSPWDLIHSKSASHVFPRPSYGPKWVTVTMVPAGSSPAWMRDVPAMAEATRMPHSKSTLFPSIA